MNKVEDGMGFAGLVPTQKERQQEVYEETRRKIAKSREENIRRLIEENYKLREVLMILIKEKCDYMKLNNLGDPEQTRTIKIARGAMSK